MDEEQLGPSTDEKSSRLTTTIPRPAHRRASDSGRSRLGDLRRRGPKADRISTRRSAWLFGLAALVVAGAIGAALFGLPVRTWFDQDDQLDALEHELDEMQTVNQDLQNEVERLKTDDGIREAAREELGQIQAGERRQTVLDYPALPRDLPAGWPYSQVDQIMTMRAGEAAAAAAGTEPDGDGDVDGGGGGLFQPINPQPPSPATTTVPATTVAATPPTTLAGAPATPAPTTGAGPPTSTSTTTTAATTVAPVAG